MQQQNSQARRPMESTEWRWLPMQNGRAPKSSTTAYGVAERLLRVPSTTRVFGLLAGRVVAALRCLRIRPARFDFRKRRSRATRSRRAAVRCANASAAGAWSGNEARALFARAQTSSLPPTPTCNWTSAYRYGSRHRVHRVGVAVLRARYTRFCVCVRAQLCRVRADLRRVSQSSRRTGSKVVERRARERHVLPRVRARGWRMASMDRSREGETMLPLVRCCPPRFEPLLMLRRFSPRKAV